LIGDVSFMVYGLKQYYSFALKMEPRLKPSDSALILHYGSGAFPDNLAKISDVGTQQFLCKKNFILQFLYYELISLVKACFAMFYQTHEWLAYAPMALVTHV
jgi:hypothetical protein